MNEVTLLFVRARESLTAAQLMSREDLPNIAASRAYYEMFYNAEALLLQRGLAYSSHSAVIAAFGKEFARTKEFYQAAEAYLKKNPPLAK